MRYHFKPISIGLVVTALLMSLGCEGEDLTTANTTIFKRRTPAATTQMKGGLGGESPLPDQASAVPSASPSATASIEPVAETTAEPSPEVTAEPSPDVTPDPTPTPTETPLATPTPSAPPTPSPRPSPTPTPSQTPSVTRVVISPSSATINASAPGATGFVTSVRLSATVTMSDGSTHDHVTWSSSDPLRATVTADGTVTAPSTATPGEVLITATAQGSSMSASATVTVTSNGRVNVIVE